MVFEYIYLYLYLFNYYLFIYTYVFFFYIYIYIFDITLIYLPIYLQVASEPKSTIPKQRMVVEMIQF